MQAIEISFLNYFSEIKDPRSPRNQLYSISEILLVTLCAAICGAEGWQDVEDFGNLKIRFLRDILPFANGIPSDDTFRRFFRSIDAEQFQKLFRSWVKSLQTQVSGKVIAIDGKSSRRSYDGEGGMLHMVSAYASEARLVLCQEKVSEKSNEITAIPNLLKWLDIKGSTVTIDALGCQHKIADDIKTRSGDYVFSLKGNQGNLHEDVKLYLNDLEKNNTNYYEDFDKGHGRIETRKCLMSNDVAWLRDRHPNWSSIRTIARIEAIREIKGKATSDVRYYISSLEGASAKRLLSSVRSHWAIENSLHWVLDMSFGENQSRIRKDNAPQVMAVIRHLALNLLQLKKAQMPRQSIKRLRKMAGWANSVLLSIIQQQFS